ncbi:hypothetical protein U0C82_08985 [Fulvimarina sp. 2208YS6-2-32]|uniref:Fe2OG dioxygenase domain-containing protein n=1 Tax=Fulvimarina uroteuthidis TaxID=3098149 RepID=A0ABU5I1M6_9HYPH|nr:hypothetical protein [Fulvimarina sp. 2208YS6-2-32]MDY8109276.1 hypothetical protein [Fulvimarina sp. 2208YS6-2-32]
MLRVTEIRHGHSDPDELAHAFGGVIGGEVDVIWLRGFVSPEICAAIAQRFDASDEAKPRADNVPGIMVGESHYFKSPDDYYQRCHDTVAAVEGLFEGISPVREFYKQIADGLNLTIRPARHDGGEALHTRAIEWKDKSDDDFLLQPHDDVSQVFCERNDNWEISEIGTLVAINFYARCEAGQGMLRVYDLRHSPEIAKQIGLECKGYPYPPEMIAGADLFDVPVASGDFAIINGALIHGVLKSNGGRIVLNSFIGDVSEREFIYWT